MTNHRVRNYLQAMYLLAVCYLFFKICNAAPLNNTLEKLEFDANALTADISAALSPPNSATVLSNRAGAVKNALLKAFYGSGQRYNVLVNIINNRLRRLI